MNAPALQRYSGRYSARYSARHSERTSGAEIEIEVEIEVEIEGRQSQRTPNFDLWFKKQLGSKLSLGSAQRLSRANFGEQL